MICLVTDELFKRVCGWSPFIPFTVFIIMKIHVFCIRHFALFNSVRCIQVNMYTISKMYSERKSEKSQGRRAVLWICIEYVF